jgi:hypothetical protein
MARGGRHPVGCVRSPQTEEKNVCTTAYVNQTLNTGKPFGRFAQNQTGLERSSRRPKSVGIRFSRMPNDPV